MLQYFFLIELVGQNRKCIPFASSPRDCFNDIRLQFQNSNEFSILKSLLKLEKLIFSFIEKRRRIIFISKLIFERKIIQMEKELKNVVDSSFSILNSLSGVLLDLMKLDQSVDETFFDKLLRSNATENGIKVLHSNFMNFTKSQHLDKRKGIAAFFNVFVIICHKLELQKLLVNETLSNYSFYFDEIYDSLRNQTGKCSNTSLVEIRNLSGEFNCGNNNDTILSWNVLNFKEFNETYQWENLEMIKFTNLIFENGSISLNKMIETIMIPQLPISKKSLILIPTHQNNTFPNNQTFHCSPGRCGENCTLCPVGFWSNDGYFHICANAPLNITQYSSTGQTNSSCEFQCTSKYHYRRNQFCVEAPIGKYFNSDIGKVTKCSFPFIRMHEWYQFITPGVLNEKFSCNFTFAFLLRGKLSANISSFSIHITMKIDFKNIQPNSEFFEITNSFILFLQLSENFTFRVGVKNLQMNSVHFSGYFNQFEDFKEFIILFDQKHSLMTIMIGKKINVIFLSLMDVFVDYIIGGRFPFFPASVKNFTISSSAVPLHFQKTDPNNQDCIHQIYYENGKCLCDWGSFRFGNNCIECPSFTFGSIFPRDSPKDCKCIEGYYLAINNTCQKINSLDSIIDFNQIAININQRRIFQSPLKVCFGNIFDITVYRNQQFIDNNTMRMKIFDIPGPYVISITFQYLNETYSDVSEFEILKKLEDPSIYPNSNISSIQRLHIFSKVESKILFSVNSNVLKLYSNETFISPGDVLLVIIESPEFEFYPNQIIMEYQNISKTDVEITILDSYCSSNSICFFLAVVLFFASITPTLSCMVVVCIVYMCCHIKIKKRKIGKKKNSNRLRFVIALYDFETTEENEMKLSLAQKIELISKVNDQWWYGRNLKTFEEGYFPRSYVKEI
jgi:hypothetical protein